MTSPTGFFLSMVWGFAVGIGFAVAWILVNGIVTLLKSGKA